jgi:hypothetical protein
MGSNTVPKFLEDKLKKEYGADSKIPYKVMNKIGAMHGNKETAKGRAMEAKHAKDMKKAKPRDSESHAYNWRSRRNLKRGA